MKIGVMYSGVGGCNGADYVADFLANGFRRCGIDPTMIGKYGGYNAMDVKIPKGLDLIVHSSGFNLTPDVVKRVQDYSPLAMWTHNDEIGFWREIIKPVTKLVDHHFSYTKAHKLGKHVKYMPLAGDDVQYRPIYEGYPEAKKVHDVSLIGANRTWRKTFTDAIDKRFKKCFFSYSMVLDSAKINKVYNESKVVVAPVQDCDEDKPASAWGCPCRTFDVPASKACQIQVKRGGVADVYPDAETIDPIQDVEEAIEVWSDRISELIADPKLRGEIAERDYLHTVENHLYKHRALQFMEAV